ncbi:alpha/beta hydrolase [Nocardia inohanensis]|uniref:alpha/beta hydrolase n=1 Tax=Nocardia inohanensis TaxID=209246 RepID=UPI00082EC09D|nr:alpha/beta hydrolase [Nocardia inohanensis]
MTASLPARLLGTGMRMVVRPATDHIPANRAGIAFIRAAAAGALRVAMLGERLEPVSVVDADSPHGPVRGEWVGGAPRPGQPILYYLHGSGFVILRAHHFRGLASQLAHRTGRSVFTLRYRMAPEYRFPAAHDDALAGYRWLLDQGHAPSDIVVGGDSAGGHLALALTAQLRALELPQPAAIFTLAPLVDATFGTAAATESTANDPFVTARAAYRFLGRYAHAVDDPLIDLPAHVSPDTPPLFIQVGECEMLRADAERYAAALTAAGGDCTVRVWPELFHGFYMGYRIVPEARAALGEIVDFIAATTTADLP